jgi:hypothetical protein
MRAISKIILIVYTSLILEVASVGPISLTSNSLKFPNIFCQLWENRLTRTDLMLQASTALDISPPWNAPAWMWRFAWNVQRAVMPLLHFFDACAPKESYVNLSVLWWKAIAGNRRGSETDDGGIAHDLLPPVTRNIVGFPLASLYPKLHHQNVALRTAFLDRALNEILDELGPSDGRRADADSSGSGSDVRVITLGAGFDTRSLRFRNPKASVPTKIHAGKQKRGSVTEPSRARSRAVPQFFEIDLSSVVEQKRKILNRFLSRRPEFQGRLPSLLEADLNDLEGVQMQLKRVFDGSAEHEGSGSDPSISSRQNRGAKKPTIVLVEAVLMYLDQNKVVPLLSSCMKEAAQHSSSVHFCFADRFPDMPYSDIDPDEERYAAEKLLKGINLELVSWQGKPGRARHMGVAKYTGS